MDIGQLYMASPDWIKGLMVILPHLTLYATARLVFRRERSSLPGARRQPVSSVSMHRHLPARVHSLERDVVENEAERVPRI